MAHVGGSGRKNNFIMSEKKFITETELRAIVENVVSDFFQKTDFYNHVIKQIVLKITEKGKQLLTD